MCVGPWLNNQYCNTAVRRYIQHRGAKPPAARSSALIVYSVLSPARVTVHVCQAAPVFDSKNRAGIYRYLCLGVWLGCSFFMVLDRFLWNVWPRQTICEPGCGGDFFCDMDDVSLEQRASGKQSRAGELLMYLKFTRSSSFSRGVLNAHRGSLYIALVYSDVLRVYCCTFLYCKCVSWSSVSRYRATNRVRAVR